MRTVGRQHALVFMVACLLVAALLRLPDLSHIPPGLHYDEAANGVLAGDIGLRGARPVFISSYTGKEVLFFYLAGGVMRLVGESVFSLRLTAALVGLLTVAMTYRLGREMGLDRRVVLVAAALLAVSFWHLLFSRLGFRAITQPLLQAWTLATLLRGMRRQQWRWLAAAGVGLGLTGYTYLAARIFPLLLLLAAAPLLWAGPGRRRGQLLLVAATGGLVLTPLLRYFVTYPDAFWVRISQVAPGEAAALTLSQSLLKSMEMFFLVGDPYIRFNLPERPLFTPFWGTLLLVGWLYSAWRWRAARADWERMVLLLLILNPLVMILPTALAVSEIVPSNLRALGLVPLVFFLPAVGLLVLLQSVEGWLRSRMATLAAVAVGLVLLLLGGILTSRLYFRTWATEPALRFESDGDLVAVADFVDQLATPDQTVYVAARHYQHPTLAFLSQQYDRLKWLPGSQALVFPASGPALYVFPYNSPLPAWAEPYLADHLAPSNPFRPGSRAPFTAYVLPAAPTLPATRAVQIDFGGVVTLLDYRVEAGRNGESMPLTLTWRVTGRPAAAYVPFVHLEDMWRHRWSQAEPDAYPAAQWTVGDTIVQRVMLPVPPGAPPGPYRLRIGLFDPATGARLPQLDEAGRYAGDALTVANVAVLAGPVPDPLPSPPQPVHRQAVPGLRLVGYAREQTRVATGETLPLALWWEATRPLPPLTTRLELLRPDNSGRVLIRTQPVHDSYPFHQWYTPQFLIDRVDPLIPVDFPPGNYRLQLRLMDAEDETTLEVALGQVSVAATERLFTPPPLQTAVAATFGQEIDLLGYELTATAGETARLQLVWQARQAPAADYTVFVHVLFSDGTCCAWQADVMPRQNQYPTGRWLAGEVVVDPYDIMLPADLPPGKYPLEVGLYVAETGVRLQAARAGQPPADAILLQPLLVGESP